MSMPKITVVIPTHNRSRFLKKCLRSVIAQTFRDYEIIVVDDGSTDDTPALLDRLSYKGLTHVRLDACSGSSAAYNAGVARASGSVVAFLDDDDTWHPRKLERQVEFMEAAKAQFSYTDFDAVAPDGRRLCRRCLSCPEDDLFNLGHAASTRILDIFRSKFVFNTHFPALSSVMMRRRLLDRVGPFDARFKQAFFDADMWKRVYAECGGESFQFFRPSLMRYCLHPGQSTLDTVKFLRRTPQEFRSMKWSAREFAILLDYALLMRKSFGHDYCLRGRHFFCKFYPKLSEKLWP